MAKKFLKPSFKKAQFYLRSDTPREGYEKVPFGEGKVTYHKYQDKVSGILESVVQGEITKKEGGKIPTLELTATNGDSEIISMPLKKANGNFTEEAKAFISALYSVQPNSNVTISVRSTQTTGKDGKSYENLNVYINYPDELVDGKPKSSGFIPFGEIPRAIKDEDPDLGTTYDWKPVNKFFALKLKEITTRFEEQAPVSVDDDDDDDLPF